MLILKKLIALIRPVIDRFPRIANAYRSVRDNLSITEEAIATPWGFKLAGSPDMAHGDFEPVETGLVRSMLKDVDVFVNVGANIGYYCCHALSMGKKVIAFEPMQQNLRHLCKNIKINDWNDAEIFPIALSNCTGILEIYGGGTGASILKGWAGTPESYVSLVPASTMDNVLGHRLRGKKALILVDIEGAEKWMLEGAPEILVTDPKPTWVIEIMTKDHQPDGVNINPQLKSTFQLFFQNGYQAFNFNQDMRPVTMDDVDQVSNGCKQFETYNFLFCDSNLSF